MHLKARRTAVSKRKGARCLCQGAREVWRGEERCVVPPCLIKMSRRLSDRT